MYVAGRMFSVLFGTLCLSWLVLCQLFFKSVNCSMLQMTTMWHHQMPGTLRKLNACVVKLLWKVHRKTLMWTSIFSCASPVWVPSEILCSNPQWNINFFWWAVSVRHVLFPYMLSLCNNSVCLKIHLRNVLASKMVN